MGGARSWPVLLDPLEYSALQVLVEVEDLDKAS